MEDNKFKVNLEIQDIEINTNHKILVDDQFIPVGYETTTQLRILECIKHEVNLNRAQKPHIAWQLIHSMISSLATEYPTLVHFAIAREALKDEETKKIDRRSKEYKDIVIQVATLLNDHCQKLRIYLYPQNFLKEVFNELNYSTDTLTESTSSLTITDWSEVVPTIDSCFEKNKTLLVDNKFLAYLRKIGSGGKEIANKLEIEFRAHYDSFKTSKKYPLSFWFNPNSTPEQPIFFSYALKALAKAIWRDKLKNRLDWIDRVPAIIKNDQEYIIGMFSKDKKIAQTEQQIRVFSHGQLLGEVAIPMIPEGTIGTILNGINKMKLVEGHRVLRYVPRTAFNQAVSGDSDYRIIKRESFRDIAGELGLRGEKSIRNMIDVFQAMAYFEFKRPNFSGNLIALKRFKSAKTHRLEGVEITVGTMLLPHRASEDFKSGQSNLMIPILSDPILVGSNGYYAGQYLLQMLVMAEFVRQSIDFAKYNCIKISNDIWQKMAQESGVLPILHIIIDRWTQDGSDGPKFLDIIDGDFYTLGPSYQKEIDFLIRQGNYRVSQSNRALKINNKK